VTSAANSAASPVRVSLLIVLVIRTILSLTYDKNVNENENVDNYEPNLATSETCG
jgi:hypothetical protein